MSDESRPSKTQRKRAADELQALGERLLTLPESRLAGLPLPERLKEAVRLGRQLEQRGALRRQRQYIGKLMRELDTEALQAALHAMARLESEQNGHFHAMERWRDRLMTEGAVALEAFFDAYPEADRQRFRQLVPAARAEAANEQAPRRQRELFREIRHVFENFEATEQTGKMPG